MVVNAGRRRGATRAAARRRRRQAASSPSTCLVGFGAVGASIWSTSGGGRASSSLVRGVVPILSVGLSRRPYTPRLDGGSPARAGRCSGGTAGPRPRRRGQDPAGARGARARSGAATSSSSMATVGGGIRARQLRELGARADARRSSGPAPFDAPDASADVVVSCWSAFRGADPAELAEAGRVLRPGGRLLVGPRLRPRRRLAAPGDLPEYGALEPPRRSVPRATGFKIRVVHCCWTFESLDDGRDFLDDGLRGSGPGGRRPT